MVKVKKTGPKNASALVDELYGNETYVVGPIEENDEEMNDPEGSEDEGEESEEKEDSEKSDEDEVPLKRMKPGPKRVQKKAKEEETPPANLAKVLKAKGKDKKAAVVKTNNSDSQPSKSSAGKQKMLDVILGGLSTLDTRKGVSFPALKKYILEEDSTSNIVSWERVRPKVKAAIEQGLQEDLIVRPKGSESSNGLQGSFKLNKAKYSSKISNAEKTNKKVKDSAPAKTTSKIPKSETSKKTLKTKSKEAESLPKKRGGTVKHRRSVSEDFTMSEWKTKKLKKSRSMEEVPEEPKKKLQKLKKKTTPKKK